MDFNEAHGALKNQSMLDQLKHRSLGYMLKKTAWIDWLGRSHQAVGLRKPNAAKMSREGVPWKAHTGDVTWPFAPGLG